VLAGVALLTVCFGRSAVMHFYEPKFLRTGPDGPETPGNLGLAYERVRIPSGRRQLDAYLVNAEAGCQPRVALLIFHGVGETISEWVEAQRFLHDHCVSSIVFDYSGYGDSSKPGTIANADEDAVSAYSYFASRFGASARLNVLGHSLGNGPMLEEAPLFRPVPAGVVVANGFSSLREMRTSRLTYVLPGVWDNVENVSRVRVPVLVVHSDADQVIPPSMGDRVFQAASDPKQEVVLHGFGHDALFRAPSEEWWAPVLAFLRVGTKPATS